MATIFPVSFSIQSNQTKHETLLRLRDQMAPGLTIHPVSLLKTVICCCWAKYIIELEVLQNLILTSEAQH